MDFDFFGRKSGNAGASKHVEVVDPKDGTTGGNGDDSTQPSTSKRHKFQASWQPDFDWLQYNETSDTNGL